MDDLDHLAHAAHPSVSRASGGHPAQREAISYSPASRPRVRAPRYSGIVLGAMVLYIVGGSCVFVGVMLVVFALQGLGGAGHSAAGSDTVMTGMFTLEFRLGAAVVGAGLLFMLAGSVAMAIRDIARNSFGH